MKIDFNQLKEIFGDTLPAKDKFLSNGEHTVCMKDIAEHYGVRKGHTEWDRFVADFAKMFAKAPAAKVKEPVVKEDTDDNKDR